MNRQISSVVLAVALAFGMTALAKAPQAGVSGTGVATGPVACGLDTLPAELPKYPCVESGPVACGIDTSPAAEAPKYPCVQDIGR